VHKPTRTNNACPSIKLSLVEITEARLSGSGRYFFRRSALSTSPPTIAVGVTAFIAAPAKRMPYKVEKGITRSADGKTYLQPQVFSPSPVSSAAMTNKRHQLICLRLLKRVDRPMLRTSRRRQNRPAARKKRGSFFIGKRSSDRGRLPYLPKLGAITGGGTPTSGPHTLTYTLPPL